MRDFLGPAYVAFADLCGLKEFMRNQQKAYDALNRLYNQAYNLGEQHGAVSAIAISDCVIAWVAEDNNGLDTLLTYLKSLHVHMLEGGYLMRSTIARGRFQYEQRINLQNLNKGMMYGDAYLAAYLANDKEQVGSIIVLEHDAMIAPVSFAPLHARFVQRKRPQQDRGHWEFFWSVREPDEIEPLRRARDDSYKARFAHLTKAYRGETTAPVDRRD